MSAEFDRGMAAAMKSNPRMTPEMVGQMRNIGLRVAQFGGFFTPIGILLTGAGLWLIGKLFEAKQKFSARDPRDGLRLHAENPGSGGARAPGTVSGSRAA